MCSFSRDTDSSSNVRANLECRREQGRPTLVAKRCSPDRRGSGGELTTHLCVVAAAISAFLSVGSLAHTFAQPLTIPILITDLEGRPVSGIRIFAGRSSLTPATTNGRTELVLDPRVSVGEAIALSVPASEAQRWVLITTQIFVPSTEETEAARVVVIPLCQ